jgi:hypothetical protein
VIVDHLLQYHVLTVDLLLLSLAVYSGVDGALLLYSLSLLILCDVLLFKFSIKNFKRFLGGQIILLAFSFSGNLLKIESSLSLNCARITR